MKKIIALILAVALCVTTLVVIASCETGANNNELLERIEQLEKELADLRKQRHLQAAEHIDGARTAEVRIEALEIVKRVRNLHPGAQVGPFGQIRYQRLGLGSRLVAADQNLAI